MLIVEGPDGAGKSTLINQLCAKYKGLKLYDAGHRSELADGNIQYRCMSAIQRAIMPDKKNVDRVELHDRLFFSELVYGQIIRGHINISLPIHQLFVSSLNTMMIPTIFCLPPLEVVRVNVAASEQMPGVKEKIDEIYAEYEHLAGRDYDLHFKFIYDYTQPSRELDQVVKAAFDARELRSPW